MNEINTLSVISCRASRSWPAPIAARTANSRRLPWLRASTRLPMFAQATSRTRPSRQRDQQRLAQRSEEILAQRDKIDVALTVCGGVLRLQLTGEGRKLGACSFQRHTRPEATDCAQKETRAVCSRSNEIDRNEQLRFIKRAMGIGVAILLRQHTNDGVRLPVQPDRLVKDRGIAAVTPLPGAPAQHRHFVLQPLALLEATPERGPHAEYREKVWRNESARMRSAPSRVVSAGNQRLCTAMSLKLRALRQSR